MSVGTATFTAPLSLLNREQAASYIALYVGVPITVSTLKDFAYKKKGPPYRLWGTGRGRHAVYAVADLDDWIAAQLTDPSTQAA